MSRNQSDGLKESHDSRQYERLRKRSRSRERTSTSKRNHSSERSLKKERDRSRDRSKRSRSRERFSRKQRSRSRERTTSKRSRKEKVNLESVQSIATDEMQKLMGFGNFNTTKNKKVADNVAGMAKINKPRKYRQYMNRKGGFNRPLDFVA